MRPRFRKLEFTVGLIADRQSIAVGERVTFKVSYADIGNVADQTSSTRAGAPAEAGEHLRRCPPRLGHRGLHVARRGRTEFGTSFALARFVATAPGDMSVEFGVPADVEGDSDPRNTVAHGHVTVVG